jgi:hypothetical protein
MRMAAPLMCNAIHHRRGRIGIAPHADREPEQKQRLDVVTAAGNELAADDLRLCVLTSNVSAVRSLRIRSEPSTARPPADQPGNAGPGGLRARLRRPGTKGPRGNNRIIFGRASYHLVMAGEGRPSTSLLPAQREDVDADLRRHDDVGDRCATWSTYFPANPNRSAAC